jgi:Ca-activated chloride channel family protein
MSWLVPFALPAAVALPILVAVGLWLFARRRRRVARAFDPSPRPERGLAATVGAVPWMRLLLALLAALALSGALLTARAGAGPERGAGGAVVLVLDVSNSMLTEDVKPNRLTLLRATAHRLLSHLTGTPVGIVVFAGRAYALSPPTTDPGALELYLDALDPQMVTQTGTSLSAAVRQAVGLLATTRGHTGSIVLISDGNAQETPDELGAATSIAKRAGMPVYTVGIGTPQGGPVPRIDFRTGRRNGFIPDPAGGNAISRLDENLLRYVASETRGEYLPLGTGEGVDRLGALLGGGGAAAGGGEEEPARYAWFAGAALLLLVAEVLIARRRRVEP